MRLCTLPATLVLLCLTDCAGSGTGGTAGGPRPATAGATRTGPASPRGATGRPPGTGHHFGSHGQACAEASATARGPACTYDSDCGLCHDGSACGTVVLATEVRRRGDACRRKDAAECELFGVHCCAGHCVQTAQHPGCKPGVYDLVGQCDLDGRPGARPSASPSPSPPPRPRGAALNAQADTDGDGIPDAQDKCPTEPEDRDGHQDLDGCPDPDNDGDGIPDVRDKCPNDPEDRDGHQDDDGCPDP